MFWNYRVRKRLLEDCIEEYDIVEVFYKLNENGESHICGWTKSSMSPSDNCIGELSITLEHMSEALKKPILDEEIELKRLQKEIVKPSETLSLDEVKKELSLEKEKSCVNCVHLKSIIKPEFAKHNTCLLFNRQLNLIDETPKPLTPYCKTTQDW
jgi:hypothetical protein